MSGNAWGAVRSFFRHPFHTINTSPRFQFGFHLAGTFWGAAILVAMPVVYFATPSVWRSTSVLALVLITLYGNGSTDYTGVSDAEAAGHSEALRGFSVRAHPHHRLAGRALERVTLDAHFQYRFHLILTYNWLLQGVAAIGIYVFAPGFWNKYAILYTLLVNGYTNWGTDFSALPGTLAAEHLQDIRKGQSPWIIPTAVPE